MNSIRKSLTVAAAAGAAMLASATPEISAVTMEQGSGSRQVTITYRLTEDAVVTLDVLTNATPNAATGWASIGGKAVCNAQGAVWRKVTSADADGDGKYTITWRPDNSWKDEFGNGFKIADGCAKAVVTAYALDNTPDYMVVDLAAANTVRYYPSVEFLPGSELGQTGAVTNNFAYRTTSLLMRKVMADGVEWTMGSADGETARTKIRETPHRVALTNNYYIGVFEITQAQWKNIATNSSRGGTFSVDGMMRPIESVCYNEIRIKANSNVAATSDETAGYSWPKRPHPSSFLGLLRSKTGVDFDLPSEAQWEFAARSGHGSGFWNDGSAVKNTVQDDNLDGLGRYLSNNPGGSASVNTLAPSDGGTAVSGSYKPNDWGLYDMHGNVREWCLDWYADDITGIGGKVNIDPAIPANTLSGVAAEGVNRVWRGGCWNVSAGNCRAAFREGVAPTYRNSVIGFRVVCTAGLK